MSLDLKAISHQQVLRNLQLAESRSARQMMHVSVQVHKQDFQ